jgi:predicted site-specific integrase-resolvase
MVDLKPEDLDKGMSPAEAAKFLGLAEKTLQHWRRQGKGPVYYQTRKNGPAYYKLRWIIEWQNKMARRSTSDFQPNRH